MDRFFTPCIVFACQRTSIFAHMINLVGTLINLCLALNIITSKGCNECRASLVKNYEMFHISMSIHKSVENILHYIHTAKIRKVNEIVAIMIAYQIE